MRLRALALCALILCARIATAIPAEAQVNTPEPLATPRYAPTPKRIAPVRSRNPRVLPTSDPRRTSLAVVLTPKASAPLDAFVVNLAVVNKTGVPTVLHFASSDLYVMEIRKGASVLYSTSYQHRPVPVERSVPIGTGRTTIANVTFDGLTNDRRALAPGAYTLRTTFLAFSPPSVVDLPLRILPATPLAAVAKAKNGAEIVVVGSPGRTADGKPGLTDGTTTIALSRNLGLLARGPHVVRGYVDVSRDAGTVLSIIRYAPTADNDSATPPPTPVPTPRATYAPAAAPTPTIPPPLPTPTPTPRA
jgi:hypothetical protein